MTFWKGRALGQKQLITFWADMIGFLYPIYFYNNIFLNCPSDDFRRIRYFTTILLYYLLGVSRDLNSLDCFLTTAGDRLALYSLSLYTLKLFFIIQVSVTQTLVIIYDKEDLHVKFSFLNTSKICIVLFSA